MLNCGILSNLNLNPMKKLILLFALILSGMLIQAQKSVKIKKEIDEFTGAVKLYTTPQRALDYKANGKLLARAMIVDNNDGNSSYLLILQSPYYNGLGCVGEGRGIVYLKFGNDEVVNLEDFGEPNCPPSLAMGFYISLEDYKIISTNSLVKVRMNGTESTNEIKIRNTEQLKAIFQALPYDTKLDLKTDIHKLTGYDKPLINKLTN